MQEKYIYFTSAKYSFLLESCICFASMMPVPYFCRSRSRLLLINEMQSLTFPNKIIYKIYFWLEANTGFNF